MSSGSSVRFIVIQLSSFNIFHGLDHHLIPWPHHSLTQHFRIEPTPSWILFLGNALDVSIPEPLGILSTGSSIIHDFDLDVWPDLEPVTRFQLLPLKPGERQVLSGGTGLDRMAFVLQPLDQVLREQAESSIEPAVHVEIPLPVPLDTGCGNDGLQHRTFRHPPVRQINLVHVGIGWSSCLGHPLTPSQDSTISNSNPTQPSCSRR